MLPRFFYVSGCGGGLSHSRCAFDGVATKSNKDSLSAMAGFSFTQLFRVLLVVHERSGRLKFRKAQLPTKPIRDIP